MEQKPIQTRPAIYTEYIVNLKAPKHILHQSYRVHVFLGEFDSDTNSWLKRDALVGTFAVFGKETTLGHPEATGCGKCTADAEAGQMVTGTVPLTAQIVTVGFFSYPKSYSACLS